jgi:GT2 family glycosyltransferase
MEIEKMVTGDGLDLMGVTKAGVSENIGFGQGFNMAVHGSCGEIIHLLSNDVQVRGDFIAPVEESLYLVPRAVVGQTLVANKAGWNEFGGDLPITYLSGHYLAMRRETWDAIGGFDDRYHPYDYEDMDLSMTAMKQGRALLSTPVLPLIHQVAGTIGYTPERFEHTVKMRKLFAEKWGFENIPERP